MHLSIFASAANEEDKVADSTNSTYVYQQDQIYLTEGTLLFLISPEKTETKVTIPQKAKKHSVSNKSVLKQVKAETPKKHYPKNKVVDGGKFLPLPYSAFSFTRWSSKDCAVTLSPNFGDFSLLKPERIYSQLRLPSTDRSDVDVVEVDGVFSFHSSSLTVRPPPGHSLNFILQMLFTLNFD